MTIDYPPFVPCPARTSTEDVRAYGCRVFVWILAGNGLGTLDAYALQCAAYASTWLVCDPDVIPAVRERYQDIRGRILRAVVAAESVPVILEMLVDVPMQPAGGSKVPMVPIVPRVPPASPGVPLATVPTSRPVIYTGPAVARPF